ncbi:ABC transporter ATP-binding protein [Bacillus sp. FSL W7-1360]
MLHVQAIKKVYDKQIAVHDVSFHIGQGEVVGLVGPNGSGKTTTINAILNVINLTDGAVHMGDFPCTSKSFKKQVSYVPDDLLLPHVLTGKEYIEFVAAMYELDIANNERLTSLIDIFDMKEALKKPIEAYSHGMKKKIQLISAVMLDTKLLVLDEPFRGLDIEASIITKKLIKNFTRQNCSLLLSTHDLLTAEALCDRIVILSKGEKVAEGSPEELKQTYGATDLEEVFLIASGLKSRSDRYEKIIQNM